MKRKLSALVLAIVLLAGTTSCYTMEHTVGSGAQGASTEEARQWYVLWGLVPLNEVDSKSMAGGATDYEIKTQMKFVDIVIGIFTGIVTVYPMSVEVTK